MDEIIRSASAPGAGVPYYPEYVAAELGFFEDEGLRFKGEEPGQGPLVAHALANGTAHIGLGGMWRAWLTRDVPMFRMFAQVVDRYASILVARNHTSPFDWAQLIGKTVLIPGGSNPSAWILLHETLKEAGIDTLKVRFLHTFSGPESTNYYRSGVADYYLSGPPTAEQLVSVGLGAMVAYQSDAGQMPSSVYYATPQFLDREDNAAGRFVRALERGLHWVVHHDPMEAPRVLERYFSKDDPEIVAASIRSCKLRGVWSVSADIPEENYQRWHDILLKDGTVLDAPMPYTTAVDRRAAQWAAEHAGERV